MQPYVIAITGSQGKTNTAYILSKLLPKALITDMNLDTYFNVPITALKVKDHQQLAIFELGIDKVNEMDLHLEIINPNISIITGIAPVHSDSEHLGSLENIIKEKRKMIEVLRPDDFAILNYDDVNVREMAKYTKATVYFYGSNKDKCHVYTDANLKDHKNYSLTKEGTSFAIYDGDHKIEISTPLIGIHHISNIMACYLAFKLIKINYLKEKQDYRKEFIDTLENITPLGGRMSFEKGPKELFILNDSLRANIKSSKMGLSTFAQMQELPGRKIAVLGEMGEIGEDEKIKHEQLGRFIAGLEDIDIVIGIGPLQKAAQEAAFNNGMPQSKYYWAKDVLVAAGILGMLVKPQDTLYLKASLLRHMERLLMVLDGQAVGCNVTSCPFYNHCSKCEYLHKGYIKQ
jgi:UDP-N-acetylmuramoyl-tripeptide--D-alanyl-D-alanine ligase